MDVVALDAKVRMQKQHVSTEREYLLTARQVPSQGTNEISIISAPTMKRPATILVQDSYSLVELWCLDYNCDECKIRFSCWTDTPVKFDYDMADEHGVHTYVSYLSVAAYGDREHKKSFKMKNRGL